MAVGLHWANTIRQSSHTYHPFHPPIPDAHSSQPKSEDHFLCLFTFPRPSVSHFSVCFRLHVSFTLLLHLLVFCLLLIDHLAVTVSLSTSHAVFQHSIYCMKTNVTPRIHDIYFPGEVNLPACNEDGSSFKWRER